MTAAMGNPEERNYPSYLEPNSKTTYKSRLAGATNQPQQRIKIVTKDHSLKRQSNESVIESK
jgi:hypothetical protein